MSDLWSDLLTCLDLDGRAPSFEGRNLPVTALRAKPGGSGGPPPGETLTYRRLFGGQLLAQCVQAASLACPGKALKSLHVLFPREGRSDEPVRYEVETHHEGRTFATLTVVARQSRGVLAAASVSLHALEDGLDHQTITPVPAVLGDEHRVRFDLMPWDTRSEADLDSPKADRPELELWMRTPQVDPALGPALTAYATDLTLIGTALRPLDEVSQRDAGTAFTSAVTSHTLWYHRPVRTDGWLLLRQHSPLVAHGRCFGRGDVLTEDGFLVASYAQEALLRFAQ